jgi:outer membrane protein, heavy metal efflux system
MSSSLFLKPLALIGLLLTCSFAIGAEKTTVLTLQAATELAIADNPDLAQMQERAKAMAAIPSQEGTLPDPQISFNAMSLPVNTFNTRQEDMTQLGVSVSQAIPFPGKLALREQAAQFEAQAATHNITEVRQRLLSEVKNTWWLIFYLDRALTLLDSNHTALQQFVEIAQTKYKVGIGLQQDVILAQLEVSKLLDQELMLNASRRNAVASLNALLNKPANTVLKLPETVVLKLPNVKAEAQLYQVAENSRAILESNRQSIQAAQSRLDFAKKDFLPDFTVEVGYGARANTLDGNRRSDLLSLGVSMNVPIFAAQKQAKAVDQRSSELMREKYALQDEWNKTRSQITQAYTDYQRAKNQVVLYNAGIVPQAKQTVASMLAGYQVNKVDFLNLVRSQITLFEYQIQYWKAFTEANQTLAQLTAAVGKEEIYE